VPIRRSVQNDISSVSNSAFVARRCAGIWRSSTASTTSRTGRLPGGRAPLLSAADGTRPSNRARSQSGGCERAGFVTKRACGSANHDRDCSCGAAPARPTSAIPARGIAPARRTAPGVGGETRRRETRNGFLENARCT
jgi:hypothetical protein